ncbi:MAG TPA: inositol monophosphatase family protein [Candidatus Baltobacteraceae bacterium]|nr:inositol monophosphatase family protein [Candidatus Baltobacteraceae bacterium]
MPSPLETALAAARASGAILLDFLHRPLHLEEKGRRADLVTEADRESEKAIVAILRAAYPDAAILGEEGGTYAGDSNERWIVDPLDGTTNYAHGYPFFCVSIGYERAGEMQAGVIYAPLMNECFEAERGAGARCNGEPIHVSGVEPLSSAMLVTGFKPYDFATNAPYFARASERAQAVRRDGSAALDLAYTAMGRFDGFWEFDLAPWDTAAGSLLVREAGGSVTASDGTPFALSGRSIVATNARIHGELVAMLG